MKYKWYSISMLIITIVYFSYAHQFISFYYFVALAILYIISLVWGAIFIQNNFYIKSINQLGDVEIFKEYKEKRICLTFDDGIHDLNTTKALDILKEKNVKAIFFLIGKNILQNEAILHRMYEEGHSIGNHTYSHSHYIDLMPAYKIANEIKRTNDLIEKYLAVKTTLFRPPYGVTNPMMANAIRKCNMKSIGWNIRSLDTVAKDKSTLLEKLKLLTKPNAIVLLHERCDITISVLTEYIDYCKSEGYTFVTFN